jgi:hypothetical protein
MDKAVLNIGGSRGEFTWGTGIPDDETDILLSSLCNIVYTHNYPLYIIINRIEYFSQPVSLTKAEISLYNKYFPVAIE